MKGSIIERGGSLQLRVSLGKNPATGKYDVYTETFPGTNKTKAAVRLRELLTELDRGTFVKPGKATLSEYLKAWLEDYCKPGLSPRTNELYSYMCSLHIIPTLGNIPVVELKPSQLQHLYTEKLESGLSGRTVQLIHITLHKALKNGVKTGVLMRNVSEAVDTPKIKRHEMRTLNEDDLQKVLEAAKNTPYYALFYTALFTGMRRSELLALRWQDCDLLLCQLSVTRSMQQLHNVDPEKQITFKEPKTQKSRRLIALTPSNTVILRQHQEAISKQRSSLNLPALTDSDLVFSHYDGKPYLPDSITHIWMKLVTLCGLKGINLHAARHTHASLLLKQGVHPKIVSERLGHAGIAITLDLYSHVAPGMQAAAASKFDEIALSKESKLDRELKEITK